MFEKFMVAHAPKIAFFILLALGLVALSTCLTGCAFGETVQQISDDLGDKVMQGHALVDIWKIETSDYTANGSPTGKKITIIGDIKSIPLVSRDGAIAKDYAEYRKTKTPAWYNSDNVTEEESLTVTGDNVGELKILLREKASSIGKDKTVTGIADSAGIAYTRDKSSDNGTAAYGWKSDKSVVYTAKDAPYIGTVLYGDNALKTPTGGKVTGITMQISKK